MNYLYLNSRTIKLLSLTKTILGQYTFSLFNKNYSSDILKGGFIENSDILASAIKEALTNATPNEISEKNVFLILPQESFEFDRYDIPSDIAEDAILPFVKDKIRAEKKFDISDVLHDFILYKQNNISKVNFFSIFKDKFYQFENVFNLLGLTIKNIIPETICYLKLFEKTLREEKFETILYVHYGENEAFCYLFDSLGLANPERFLIKNDIKKTIASIVKESLKKGVKIDRLILSGENSKKIRQDLFTKETGVWTNPLEKIVSTFYKDYIKLIVPVEKSSFSPITFDSCFGAFVFDIEKDTFSIFEEKESLKTVKKSYFKAKLHLPKISISKKDLIIFLISFITSFVIITFGINLQKIHKKIFPLFTKVQPSPTKEPTPRPTLTATPTKKISRSDVKIKILNGVGIVGKAKEVATILTKLGYVEIVTGNKPGFGVEKTTVSIKKSKKDFATTILKDLKNYIEIKKFQTLDETEEPDIIITIGKDFP